MNRIKYQRQRKGLSQSDLAKKINVSRSTVACWETNKAMPRIETLKKISRVFKCKIDDLL